MNPLRLYHHLVFFRSSGSSWVSCLFIVRAGMRLDTDSYTVYLV